MPIKVALVTPAPMDRRLGDSLRPRMQALGLWAIGWRDFVVFTPSPDPRLPFDQQAIATRGPWRLIADFRHGCRLAHAHQNAGLFLGGRVWTDFHGYAPLESALHWRARPWSPRATLHAAFSVWATRRLLGRAERVLCAGRTIAERAIRAGPSGRSVDVLPNLVNPEDYPAAEPLEGAPVLVIGGFTSRWGRTSLPIALDVARRCPALRLRMVGTIDPAQRRLTSRQPNVQVEGRVDDEGFAAALKASATVLMPFADWCRGGGARLKLIEAAASGLAVVATPSALENFEAAGEVCVGRTPAELAAHLERLAGDAAERRRRGAALRAFVAREHDYRHGAQRLAEFYERAMVL